jgi:hypothetical protein
MVNAMLVRELSSATERFLLIAFRAFKLFHAFFALNLEAEMRLRQTKAFCVCLSAAMFHVVARSCLYTFPP